CGMIGPEYAERVIAELLTHKDSLQGEESIFLGARCLQERAEQGSLRALRDQVRQCLLELVSSSSSNRIPTRAIQFVASGWKHEAGMAEWLKDCALNHPRAGVRRAAIGQIAQGWKQEPGLTDWLKERAIHDQYWGARRTAIEQLAQGWKQE